MRQFIAFVSGIGAWAYLIEGSLVFAEDALFFGFLFPAETVLVLCAFLAQQHALNVAVVFGIAAVAAIAGDQVGFEIGRRFGTRLKKSRLGRRVSNESWAAANELLDERGGFAVFLGRWVALLRALVPTTSGLLKMKWGTFTLFNALGGIAWAAAWTAVGYLAGASWEKAAKEFGEVSAAVVLGIVIVGVWAWHRRRKAKKKRTKKKHS